jgi:hypothetical protein
MKIELKIHWDGSANGLTEHRLSVGEFAEPLKLLLQAYRRIATNIVAQAVDTKGRYRREAARLDMEISRLESGSLGLAFLCTGKIFCGEQIQFGWLEGEAMKKLVESIEKEKDGRLDNANVRKYLQSLQGKVTRQRYSVYEDGRIVLDVDFDSCTLPEETDVPELKHIVGRVVGVGFDPGNCEVRVMSDSGCTVAGVADEDMVNEALELRFVRVHALFVIGENTRILWIRKEGEKACALSKSELRREIFDRWDEVMRRLSK